MPLIIPQTGFGHTVGENVLLTKTVADHTDSPDLYLYIRAWAPTKWTIFVGDDSGKIF